MGQAPGSKFPQIPQTRYKNKESAFFYFLDNNPEIEKKWNLEPTKPK